MNNSNHFDAKESNKIMIPSEDSVKAMTELNEGKGKLFNSVESLMKDLNSD